MDKLNQLTNKLKSLQLTVLLAEDEAISQLVFKKLAENIGCTTVITDDGKQALNFLSKTKFDIIFLDLHMPYFSGYEVINQIKKVASINSKTPVVLVSGTASDQEIKKAFKNGFDKLLTKPFTAIQFYATINEYCSSEFEIAIDSSSTIDLTMIKDLYNNEQALIDSLLKTIKQELLNNLKKMEEPSFFDTPTSVKDLIHKIRPSFNYLGLKDVAAQLLQLEKKIETGVPIKNIEEVCKNIVFITKKTLENLK